MESSIKLGPRLQSIAGCVPQHARLGDIGTDHAYLPIFLYEQGRIEKAIAIDVHEGPYQSACTAVKNAGLAESIHVRLGNGLQPLNPGEVDTLTLAGMGGNNMLEILTAKPEVLNEVSDLILQPQGSEAKVRQILLHMGWLLEQEFLIEEEGRIYVVILFSRIKGKSEQELLEQEASWMEQLMVRLEQVLLKRVETGLIKSLFWRFGPLVWDKPNELLARILHSYRQELDKASREMLKAKSIEVQQHREKLQDEIAVLKEIEQWLCQ